MANLEVSQVKDLLSALHRIERVGDIIANDKTASHHWNVQRGREITELARMARRVVNGDA